MGFFSWKTQDTNKSIANSYSNRDTFPVTMIDDKGNRYFEPNYGGYGVFGGKDFYVLLAEMNGILCDDEEETRGLGLDLAFGKFGSNQKYPSGENPSIKYPNLVELPDHWTYTPDSPESCEYQGYFYEDEDEDDGEYSDFYDDDFEDFYDNDDDDEDNEDENSIN